MDLSLSEAEGSEVEGSEAEGPALPALPALSEVEGSEAEGLEVEESEADVAHQDRRLDSRRGV